MTCNGWKNYETWLVNIWFGDMFAEMVADGEKVTAEFAKECIQSYIDDELEPHAGLIVDFVNAAMSEVDWDEIAEYHMSEDEDDEEEEDEEKSEVDDTLDIE